MGPRSQNLAGVERIRHRQCEPQPSGAVGVGGGITGWNVVGTALFKDHCVQPSELWEAGAKYSLMQNKVFLN